MASDEKFDQQAVAITGGGRGLGRGLAVELARRGWYVAICDIDEEALDSAVEEINGVGIGAGWLADVSVESDVNRFIGEAVVGPRRLIGLINNAIYAAPGAFLDLSVDEWRRSIDVSLTGYFLCGQAAARHMVGEGYGRIVNMSSGSGEHAFPGTTAYGTAKGAINSLTRIMALELAPFGVTANTLTTGPMMTDTFRRVLRGREELYEQRKGRVPIGNRFGEIDDIIGLVSYLLSPAAKWTTGALFHVDGGSNSTASLV